MVISSSYKERPPKEEGLAQQVTIIKQMHQMHGTLLLVNNSKMIAGDYNYKLLSIIIWMTLRQRFAVVVQ